MWAVKDGSEKIHLEAHRESFRLAHENKLKIVMESDTYRVSEHGENAYELECMVEAGMSEMEAIAAATLTAAESVGYEHMIDSIEEGKLADLLVVDGDPSANISVLRNKNNIKLVMKNGKIFVVGAVGAMCNEATRDLIESGGNHEFMLADANLEKLKKLKDEYRDDRINIMQIDATVFDEMLKAVQGYDFVMNGLAFGNAEPSVKACIEAKIPTILLDDFPRDYYYEGFEKSGVLCAAGVGMTPGTTDMMARWGVGRCDSVHEINVSWASFRPIAISPGLVLTTFWEMDPAEKDRAFFENGKMFPQPPLKESKVVEFEEPYGELHVYYVPHPETIRLSQLVPGIKKVVTMGTWPPIEMELLKQLVDFGVFDKKEILHKGDRVNVLDILGDLLHQLPRGTRTEKWGYALNVEVIGKREDKNVTYVLKTSHPEFKKWGGERAYAKDVAIPMSIGTQLMLAGKTKISSGYHAAYEIFEPVEFFNELAKRGIMVHERVYEYRQIVT